MFSSTNKNWLNLNGIEKMDKLSARL